MSVRNSSTKECTGHHSSPSNLGSTARQRLHFVQGNKEKETVSENHTVMITFEPTIYSSRRDPLFITTLLNPTLLFIIHLLFLSLFHHDTYPENFGHPTGHCTVHGQYMTIESRKVHWCSCSCCKTQGLEVALLLKLPEF